MITYESISPISLKVVADNGEELGRLVDRDSGVQFIPAGTEIDSEGCRMFASISYAKAWTNLGCPDTPEFAKGQIVEIFEDPITKLRSEGFGRVVSHIHDSRYLIAFDEDGEYERTI